MSSTTVVRQFSVRTSVVLMRDAREVARWPLELAVEPDIALVDDLARLRLAAHRVGLGVRFDPITPELSRLLELAGLASSFGRTACRSEAATTADAAEETEDQQHQ